MANCIDHSQKIIAIYPEKRYYICTNTYSKEEVITMSALKKYFPHAFKANDIMALIIALVIYAVIGAVGGLILGFLAILPILGIIFSIIGWLVEVYVFVGIVLSILVFLKIV